MANLHLRPPSMTSMASRPNVRSRQPLRTKRPPYRAARAFYLTLFILTAFAAFSILSHEYFEASPQRQLRAREIFEQPISTLDSDEDCRLVHKSWNQCAYIRKHCPADEGGFTAYLELYYCRLENAKPVAFTILICWLGLLFSTIGIAASDFFCIDLSTIAGFLGLSESVAGVTFLAFGNGSPDVFSTFAAMSTNSGSLAVGELFGAAGFITAVVSGSMALIRPFHVAKKSFVRDVGFFTVAAAFSMVFLWDGMLHFWECVSMVIYYIFYVCFVVAWHWWLGRRRRRREREAAARGHFLPPDDELEAEDEYHDDPEEAPDPSRPSISRGVSREDWSALESGDAATPYDNGGDEDDEEAARDRWMSELASNMRLTKPTRSRKNTVTVVRPSLVGALEFQAVLKSLQKSRNHQTIPMNSRRYSDDPTYTTAQLQDQLSSVSDPAARPPLEVNITDESTTPELERPGTHGAPFSTPLERVPLRNRAVSANDVATLQVDPKLHRWTPIHSEAALVDISEDEQERAKDEAHLGAPSPGSQPYPKSPTLRLEPATPRREAPIQRNRSPTATTSGSIPSSALLAPPDAGQFPRQPSTDYFVPRAPSRRGTDSPQDDPHSPRLVPSAKSLPKIVIPQRRDRSPSTRSTSPFPAYRDYPSPSVTASTRSPISTRPPSLYLPAPLSGVTSPESVDADHSTELERSRRPNKLAKVWPYRLLPPPGIMISTLLPTIYHWHDKTWWEKLLGIVAAPSVFLLTITLPVVENEQDSEKEGGRPSQAHLHKDGSLDTTRSKSSAGAQTLSPTIGFKSVVPELQHDHNENHAPSHEHGVSGTGISNLTGHSNTASIAVGVEQHRHNIGNNAARHAPLVAEPGQIQSELVDSPHEEDLSQSELWNRWLTIIQVFLAPMFIVFSIYLQAPSELPTTWLIKPILISLLVSLGLLIPLLLTSTPTHRPGYYRIILSLVGFVVAIAWISAIASQVVGALKALAVILNMSHAIMGLTIFAVGNSLGDLVADVTVAKLGYPVMALSACFGGPMLNILLGVGLSGSYMLIRGAEKRHEKHPNKGITFHSYHIEVSKTLIVSGITLLITLVGLLVAVPLNKWVLSKKIGWALIALWCVSTIFNVVIEMTGFLEGWEEELLHIGSGNGCWSPLGKLVC